MASDFRINLSCKNIDRDRQNPNREVGYHDTQHDIWQDICKLEHIAKDI